MTKMNAMRNESSVFAAPGDVCRLETIARLALNIPPQNGLQFRRTKCWVSSRLVKGNTFNII